MTLKPGTYSAFDTKIGRVIQFKIVRDGKGKLYAHKRKEFITYKLDRFRDWKPINT